MAKYQEEVTLNAYRAELSVMLAGIMELLAIGVYQNNSLLSEGSCITQALSADKVKIVNNVSYQPDLNLILATTA